MQAARVGSVFLTICCAAISLGIARATGETPAADIRPNSSPEGASLAEVLDTFLALHAAENPAWRRDIELGQATATSEPPSGFRKAHSDLAGWYYYRAQNSELLSSGARREVFRDPRFLSLLAVLRDRTDGKTPTAVSLPKTSPVVGTRAELVARLRAKNPGPAAPVYFTISAEELLEPQPLFVAIGENPPSS